MVDPLNQIGLVSYLIDQGASTSIILLLKFSFPIFVSLPLLGVGGPRISASRISTGMYMTISRSERMWATRGVLLRLTEWHHGLWAWMSEAHKLHWILVVLLVRSMTHPHVLLQSILYSHMDSVNLVN